MKDLTSLREALQDAIKWRDSTLKVSTSDLQSVLDRMDRFLEHGDQLPKLFGYIITDDLRNMRKGTHMFAKVKRRNTGRFDCPIYFMDMPEPELGPIPNDVYYNEGEDYFFSERSGRNMGGAFWQMWRRRKADFPQRRMTSAERETLQDLEDCMPDLDAPPPEHFSGIDVITQPLEKT